MGSSIDKTKRRMSALFSLSGGDPEQKLAIPQGNGQPMPPITRGRSPVSAQEARSSSKLTKDRRTSSWGQLNPTAQPGQTSGRRRPTLSEVDPDLNEPLPLPPPIPGVAGPGSRNSSPARSVAGSGTSSRPTTPRRQYSNPDPITLSTLNPPMKEEKRKSRGLFGRSKNKKTEESHGPLAWVIGHEGRVPYNVSALINGERVSCTILYS